MSFPARSVSLPSTALPPKPRLHLLTDQGFTYNFFVSAPLGGFPRKSLNLATLHIGGGGVSQSLESQFGKLSILQLSHVASVSQRIASRLRPDGETMPLSPNGNLLHRSCRRIEGIHDAVKASRDPEGLAVRGDIAHVGTSASRNLPRRDDLAGSEVHHRDVPRPVRLSVDLVRTAIGDVQLRGIAAGIKSVRSETGMKKPDLLKGVSVHQENPV